jgi:hypothetical protein
MFRLFTKREFRARACSFDYACRRLRRRKTSKPPREQLPVVELGSARCAIVHVPRHTIVLIRLEPARSGE